jgi:predicted RNA binding protein YcfA (HicA-like mRNA interferase family)
VARIKVLSVGVDVLFLKEGKYVVAYAPALELSSYGRTEQTARKAFDEAVSIFLEETKRKGTLERVLLKLGWTLSRNRYEPPRWTAGELLRLCRARPMLDSVTEDVRIPLVAAT